MHLETKILSLSSKTFHFSRNTRDIRGTLQKWLRYHQLNTRKNYINPLHPFQCEVKVCRQMGKKKDTVMLSSFDDASAKVRLSSAGQYERLLVL